MIDTPCRSVTPPDEWLSLMMRASKAVDTAIWRAATVLYCVLDARAGGLKSFPGARARVLGKKSTNPAEFCMHY